MESHGGVFSTGKREGESSMAQGITDFNTIMQQVERDMRQDKDAFSVDPNNPNKVIVKIPFNVLSRPLNPMEERMMRKIENVDTYSWNRGKSGGLKTGFDFFDNAIEGGLQTGLILFAASPNVGKSAFMLQLLKQTATKNEKVYCAYISLDDSLNELMPRYIASDQNITIAQAKNPERFEEEGEVIEKRNQGIKNLYRNIDRFAMLEEEDGISTIESIEEFIKELKMRLPDGTKIAIGIDSFYDITTEKNFGENDKAKFDYLSRTLKGYCKTYDVVIMCTAHLRKINGGKRPENADLKETNRLEYEANLICMLHNEVGIKEEGADIYWLHDDEEERMPVLECRFSKNKFGSYKGTRFYEFIPNQSFFMESSLEACKRYASLLHQR